MSLLTPTSDPASLEGPVQRISIITVCRNAEASIAETMRSVLQQTAVLSGRVELEYLVHDGMSTDRTLEIVESLRTPAVKVVSEHDSGLYDGLSRAMQVCTGDVVAYLNAGDYYHPCALDVVVDIMEQHRAPWLTGMTVIYNHRSHVIECSTPYLYRQRLIRCGMYGTRLPFIQQESTFWRRSMHRLIDFPRLASLKYAGDAFLWSCFAAEAALGIVQAQLGGFKIHEGQLSADRSAYRRELVRVCESPTWVDVAAAWIDCRRWHSPAGSRVSPAGGPYFRFSRSRGQWMRKTRR